MAAEDSRMKHLVTMSKHYIASSQHHFMRLNIYSKLFIIGTGMLYMTIWLTFILVGPDRIGQAIYDFAQTLSNMKYGWAILGAATIIISFPPCIGHTTCITVCGYAYGMKGFPLAAFGSQIGSALAFVAMRALFSRRLKKWAASNEKWQALETVVEAKGLPLIVLIRASPFPPWVYSNALFASIHAVSLWQFVLATFVVFPKIAIFVFVGSRLAKLSDGKQRNQMDTTTKILNVSLTLGSILIAATSSWVIYRLMQAEIRKTSGLSPEIDELAAEAVENLEEEPLLGNDPESDV